MYEDYKVIKSLIVIHSSEFVNDSGIKLALIKGLRKVTKQELKMFNLRGQNPTEYSEFGLREAKDIIEYLFAL